MTLDSAPAYDPERLPEPAGYAVVIGGSVAGLLAARVLADRFRVVTVFERDSLPDDPTPRRGVPQGHHIHALLRAGRSTIEALFPGFGDELSSAGAVELDMASDLHHFERGDFVADGPARLPTYYATRPLIEQVLRRRLTELASVKLRTNCQFVEFLADEDGSTVTGVAVRDGGGDRVQKSADLVVDATGRTSKTSSWLERSGYARPPVDEVKIEVAYSTVRAERPPDDRRALVVVPSESVKRGVGVFPIESDRWLLTYFGMADEQPPTSPDALQEYSSSLPGPDPIEFLGTTPRFSDGIEHYPFPSNRRRRYEDLDRFPDGLVVIGDAIASFNPIYGQGMSVAALEALHLHEVLAAEDHERVGRRFFARAKAVVDVAWSMAVAADFSYPHTTGPKPRGTDILNRYVARLTEKAHSDGHLRDRYYRVMNMEYAPTVLFRPEVLWRVLKPF